MKLLRFAPSGPPDSRRRRGMLAGAGATAWLAACGATHCVPPAQRFDPQRRMGPTLWDTGTSRYRFERLAFASADGMRRYRVWLAIPRGAAPASGHPLLCMTDGNAVADSLSAAELDAAGRVGDPPVVMAIDPDSDLRFDVNARALDYTPAVREESPTYDDEVRGRLGGGADVFLDLIAQRILPEVASRAPLDARRHTLWGHSYGGLLVLHTLFRRPSLFTRYAAADPSLWWHHGYILREAETAQPLPAGREAMLLMMVGTARRPVRRNGHAAQYDRARQLRASVPPDSARRLAERLSRRPELAVRYREFPALSHGPLLAASIPPALMLAAYREVPAPSL